MPKFPRTRVLAHGFLYGLNITGKARMLSAEEQGTCLFGWIPSASLM